MFTNNKNLRWYSIWLNDPLSSGQWNVSSKFLIPMQIQGFTRGSIQASILYVILVFATLPRPAITQSSPLQWSRVFEYAMWFLQDPIKMASNKVTSGWMGSFSSLQSSSWVEIFSLYEHEVKPNIPLVWIKNPKRLFNLCQETSCS